MKLFEPPGGLHTGRWTVCLAPGMLVAYSSCPPLQFSEGVAGVGGCSARVVLRPEWRRRRYENIRICAKRRNQKKKREGKVQQSILLLSERGGVGGAFVRPSIPPSRQLGFTFLARVTPDEPEKLTKRPRSVWKTLNGSTFLSLPPFRYE